MYRRNISAIFSLLLSSIRASIVVTFWMACVYSGCVLEAYGGPAPPAAILQGSGQLAEPGMEPGPHEHPASEHPMSGAGSAMEEVPHEHSAITPATSFVRILLLLTLAIGAALMFSARHSLRPDPEETEGADPPEKDLLNWPVIGKLLRSRHFPTLLIAPTVVIFLFIVLTGLLGQQNTSNPAILMTWILWWPAVIFSFVLLGRIWCLACPFGWLGDLAQKIFSLQWKVPRILRNMWWRLGLFLGLTWATTLWALDRWPFGTAWLALGLTLGAVTLAVIYEKRAFCRYVCPVGGIFGLYAMTTPLRIGVKDKQLCQQECPHKDCYQACAWFEFAPALSRNAECNLCLDCVRACPHNNITLQTQSFGADLAEFQSHRKSLDEASTVAAVLGVSLLQTMVMLDAWKGWEASVGSFLHISPGPFLYTLIFVSLGLVIPALLVALVSYLGSPRAEFRADVFRAFRTYAYAFVPLGLALHAAHNFHHLFGEGGAMWAGLRNALARYTGWASLAADEVAGSASSIGPNTLYLLQWMALIGGLYLAFHVGVAVARRSTAQSVRAFRAALPIFLFAIAYTALNIVVLSAPMAHRH